MSRRRFTESMIIETLAWKRIVIPCYRCKEPLCFVDERNGFTLVWPKGNAIEREHVTEIALGGADAPHNCAYSHKLCHAIATNGTKATTAGSSKQRIAKVRRLRGETCTDPTKKIPGRGFQKGQRKIASRPFQKRKKI